MKRLLATARLEPIFKTAFHLASTQARYALERRAWNEAARLVPRELAALDWDRFTWPEAIAQFARGLGAAHLGKVNEARAAGALLEELEAASPKEGEDLFAGNIRMLRLQKGLGLGLHVAMKNDRAGLVQDAQAYSSSLSGGRTSYHRPRCRIPPGIPAVAQNRRERLISFLKWDVLPGNVLHPAHGIIRGLSFCTAFSRLMSWSAPSVPDA